MNNDIFYQRLMNIADGDTKVTDFLVGFALVSPSYAARQAIKAFDVLDIKGKKVLKLYNDACNKDMDKFVRTVYVLGQRAYSQEEIDANFASEKMLEFVSDDVKLDWQEKSSLQAGDKAVMKKFVQNNARICKPQIAALVSKKDTENQIEC